MPDQPGFQIEGRFFPFVQSYKHGDPILIHEVTGLSWDEFADLLAESAEDGARPNPIIQTALIAVAIQRQYPTWSRRRVAQYVNNLELGSEEVVGVDLPSDEAENGSGPLPPTESGESSSSSDETSKPLPESPSNPSPTSSGDPGSEQPTPASLPTG